METKARSTKSPFKFLDSYNKEDREIYFGRDKEAQALFNKVHISNLLLLYGTSGTGKTSLVQCGLGNMFEESDWLPVFIRRDKNIIEALESAIESNALRKEKLAGKTIPEQVKALFLDHFRPVYLIFDQFEELFILGDRQEENDFFLLLPELIGSNLECKIILIMREEYLAYLDRFEEIVPHLFDNRLRLEYMRRDQVVEVIERTADSPHVNVELGSPVIPLEIMDSVRDDQGRVDLAILQVYLDRLFRNDLRRREAEEIDRPVRFDTSLIKETGRIDDVLGFFLEEQLQQLDVELKTNGMGGREVALNVLTELITEKETKQAMDVEELKVNLERKKKMSPELVDLCLRRLLDLRILRELA